MKKIWIEYIRVFATLAVILLHCSTTVIDNTANLKMVNQFDIIFLDICQLISRWAVPCFFMITGALLLNPNKKINYKKYITRIIIIIMLFGTFYSFLELFFDYRTINFKIVFQAILNTIQNKSWSHMWYLYVLIGLYLITPLLKAAINVISERELTYFIAIFGIGCLTINTVNYLFNMQIENFMLFNTYVLYYITGFYLTLDNHIFKSKNNIIWIFLCCITMSTIDIINIIKNAETLKWLTNLDNIFTFILSINVFLYFKRIFEKNLNENRVITFISKYSLLIYLIHPLFINIIYKIFCITPLNFFVPIGVILMFAIILILTLISAIIVKKVPIIGKYV